VALERAAIIAAMLMGELQSANEALTSSSIVAMQQDTEYEQFLVKLAPRIRRLEMDLHKCLAQRMELALNRLPDIHQQQQPARTSQSPEHDNALQPQRSEQQQLVVVLGHVMRALAISGRSKEVESIFARTAVLPLVRSKLSMGRLDEGGSRGECAGLTNLLNDMTQEIATLYSPVLVAAESMFAVRERTEESPAPTQSKIVMEVDLLTEGVWVPIATAFMTDAGIKMSIFSPGIASILQANYTALDSFLAQLARRLLPLATDPHQGDVSPAPCATTRYHETLLTLERIQQAQDRVYAHAKTAEFSKKWNLPIYYQLRFGECCTRMNKAVEQTKLEGWVANVYTGSEQQGNALRQTVGFELSLFVELYDTLLGLWQPDVILRPLTNRFLRGAIQLVGRTVAFINEGMDGKLLFGEQAPPYDEANTTADVSSGGAMSAAAAQGYPSRKPYCWGDSAENVASVAWELALLESALRHDYANVVCEGLARTNTTSESGRTLSDPPADIRELVLEVLKEAGDQVYPTIDKAWNQVIVNLLTQKCSGPLAAVKGVAATYRMTNRPPPTQASPFVGTILRPLKDFDSEFTNRIPAQIGALWKLQIVVTVAERYAAAVDDLIATVQRTEVALKNRKARRTAVGGMSDGEKVKLQLYLDYKAFEQSVRDVGIEPASVIGISRLSELTLEGEKLMKQNENG
jgi:conserved oligomeric Golgi complex subunit 2